ncbi:hypothetical protein BDR04DRAFT_1116448 [Suillus decipiens]|nr:hypothetical protein BDR04DRAFT_1116448 [Suillus decipiens]
MSFMSNDIKWIICAVGEAEINFCFLALQPVTGFCHFHGGILKLKQVTWRAQCDIQHSIIVSPQINDHDIECISAALAKFHANKHAITAGGFCCGQCNKPINNWYIPKIELMHNIVPSVCNTSVIMQWSADTMEHAHITEIKDPAWSSDNNNYNSQICCHLDFKYPEYARPITDYFAMAKVLQHREVGTVPLPLHTFVVECTAFHLTYSLSIWAISVDDAALKFGLPDLQPALADFLHHEDTHGKMGTQKVWKDCFLTYMQCFTSNSKHEPAMQLHLLKRAKQSNGTCIGDVIPVTQLRVPVNVVPHFGASADPHLTQYNNCSNKTIEDGMKVASLMSIPVNDIATLNKMTTIELDHLVTTEPQSLANGLLGHLLPLIFKPFTVDIPQAYILRIKLGIKKFTHKEIFLSFLNTLSTTMAESKKKLIMLSATCTWSTSNSTVAVSSSDIKRKPDLVLSNDVKPKWGNIHICAELTYSQYKPAQRIVKAADTQAYLLLSNQPWRHFMLILSFTHQYCKLRVLLYDHAGVVTPCITIHQNLNAFAQIIAAVAFGNPECIRLLGVLPFLPNMTGPDATFSSTSHPSHFSHTPQPPAKPCSQIHVKNKIYTMLKILFITKGLVGRGTVCYLIVDYWLVEMSDNIVDKTWDYRHVEIPSIQGVLNAKPSKLLAKNLPSQSQEDRTVAIGVNGNQEDTFNNQNVPLQYSLPAVA